MNQPPRSPSRRSASEVPQNISLSPAALPPELGDVRNDDPDALAFPTSINAADVARPIDELERRRAAAIEQTRRRRRDETDSLALELSSALAATGGKALYRGAVAIPGGARFDILTVTDRFTIIRDVGPWNERPTVTNDPLSVFEVLADGWLRPAARLFYFDSNGELDEMVIENGRFVGFRASRIVGSIIGAGDVSRPDLRARLEALELDAGGLPGPIATPLELESPAEHIANALLILRSSGELSAEDFAALDRRLTLALEQLRSAGR